MSQTHNAVLQDRLTRFMELHQLSQKDTGAVRGGEPLEARSGVFEFQNSEIDSDVLRFRAATGDGELRDKYIAFINPFNPSALVVCDAKLRVKGICNRVVPACPNDAAAVRAHLGAARQWEAREIAEFERRHAPEIRLLAERMENNGDLANGRSRREQKRELQTREAAARLASESLMAETGPELRED